MAQDLEFLTSLRFLQQERLRKVTQCRLIHPFLLIVRSFTLEVVLINYIRIVNDLAVTDEAARLRRRHETGRPLLPGSPTATDGGATEPLRRCR